MEIAGFFVMVLVGLADPTLLIAYFAGWWCRKLPVALIIGAANGLAAIVIVGTMVNKTPPGNIIFSRILSGVLAAAIIYGIAKLIRKPKDNEESAPELQEAVEKHDQ